MRHQGAHQARHAGLLHRPRLRPPLVRRPLPVMNMKNALRFASLLLVALSANVSAQGIASPEAKDVMAVVTRIFDGMKEADSAKVRTAFAPGARFVTVGTRANPDTITYESIDGWLGGIARSNKAWEEKLKNVR